MTDSSSNHRMKQLRNLLEAHIADGRESEDRFDLRNCDLDDLSRLLSDRQLLVQLLACLDAQNHWLLGHRYDRYSQRGEDGVVEKIFSLLPSLNRWCIEFGASNGRSNSNTLNLIEQGWSSVQIEANRDLYAALKELHTKRDNVFCLNSFVGVGGDNHLERLIDPYGVPDDLDLLSIDIDGCDYHVWQSLARLRPKVVIIEFNPTIPPDVRYIPPCDFSKSEGCSLRAVWELGRSLGYKLVCNTRANAIFVRADLADVFHVADDDPAVFFCTPELTASIFQLFDGTLVVSGNRILNWTKVSFSDRQLQVLPWFIRGRYGSRWPGLRKFWLNCFFPKRLSNRRPIERDYEL